MNGQIYNTIVKENQEKVRKKRNNLNKEFGLMKEK